MTYAIDSNIISYLLKKDQDIRNRIIWETKNANDFMIPPVVYFEVKRWLLIKQAAAQTREFDNLCERIRIGEMNIKIWHKAAELYAKLRKKGLSIDDADVLIAAFCIVNNYTLVTNNTRHFSVVDGLCYVNWK